MLEKICGLLAALMLLAIGALTIPSTALAGPVNWTLENMTFADGGTVTGSFTYDADTGTYSNISIVTAGGAVAGSTYVQIGGDFGGAPSRFQVVTAGGEANGQRTLVIQFESAFTNAGGTINWTPTPAGGEWNCTLGICFIGEPSRSIVSGRATTVPATPPTVTLLSPTSGSVSGGGTVTITGTNFTSPGNTNTVTFGVTAATGVTYVNATTLTAIAPARSAGTVNVTVSNANGASANNGALDDYTYATPEPVPTLSEWAMILFGLMLAGGAALYIQQRHQTI